MVEPDVLHLDVVGIDPEIVADPTLGPDGDVAQAHGPVALVEERLGHDPHGVGEVDQPRASIGAGRHLLRQLEHDGNRAQRLGQPARAHGLLAQASVAHGQRLVDVAGRLATDAQLDDDEVGTLERGMGIGRGREVPLHPRARRMRSESPPTTSRRTSLGSRRTRSSTTMRSSRSHRPSTSSGVYVLPPPTTATLVPTQRNVTSVRVRALGWRALAPRAGGARVRRRQHQDRRRPRVEHRRRPGPCPRRSEQPSTRRARGRGRGVDGGGHRRHWRTPTSPARSLPACPTGVYCLAGIDLPVDEEKLAPAIDTKRMDGAHDPAQRHLRRLTGGHDVSLGHRRRLRDRE